MMKFIDTIQEKENLFLLYLEKYGNNGKKTFIFGDGEGANNTEKRAGNFVFSGRMVNKKYFSEKENVFCFEDYMDQTDEKINLVVCCRNVTIENFQNYRSQIDGLLICDCFSGNYSVDPELMTYEFVKRNETFLASVYDELADDFSRKCFSAYINQKISMDYKYLQEVRTSPQYFEDFIPLNENAIFVDCGAFDGDSALAFIEFAKRKGASNFKKIISFEPDPYNYKKLCNRNIEKHLCINKGVSNEKGVLQFSVLGTSSGICDNGEIQVEIDTLDNMIDEKVAYIKMDIEGVELEALKGAEHLIRESKPTLAICIYHKKEDLWVLQNYIKSLVPEYKFYIRAYEETATELVLYAII